MQTIIAIEKAEFYAFHGYYAEEQKTGNTFILDAQVAIKSFDSDDDNIMDTVNYETLYRICAEEMANTQKLLETVVFNILTRYKEDLSHVTSGKVRMEKIGPQLGGKVGKAVVEMSF